MRCALATLIAVLMAPAAAAQGDLTQQEPITIRVDFRTEAGKHLFDPDHLTFETGKLYKLVLHNSSNAKHEFTAPDFAERIFTGKVQMVDSPEEGANTLSEIKGTIREIEVSSGATAEWWFVPVATVEHAELICEVKDEDGKIHAAKGMVGSIDIK